MAGLDSVPAMTRHETVAGEIPATLVVEQSVPPGARALIWEEFFGSRGRGIDWATHLPWAVPGKVLCASAAIASGVVAALLVRRAPGADAAMIGYVCVHPDHRGRKLSEKLIELTAAALASSRLRQMVLWTSKPRVYEGSGFTIVAQDRRLILRLRPALAQRHLRLTPWPGTSDEMGLPPFATAGWQADSDDARIIFADTPSGPTLLDTGGETGSIVGTMAAARPGEWSATIDAQDALAGYLAAHGLVIDQTEGPVTMYRPLSEGDVLPVRLPLAVRI